jgi:hypothetical protein
MNYELMPLFIINIFIAIGSTGFLLYGLMTKTETRKAIIAYCIYIISVFLALILLLDAAHLARQTQSSLIAIPFNPMPNIMVFYLHILLLLPINTIFLFFYVYASWIKQFEENQSIASGPSGL